MRSPGKPNMIAIRISDITGVGFDTMAITIMYRVNVIDAGKTSVPTNSTAMMKFIEKQNVPHKSFTRTSSIKLCTVELIHLLLWDKSTANLSGTTVLQAALATNTCFRRGNVRSINDERYLSSPSNRRFFLCKLSSTFSEYFSTMSELAKIGTQTLRSLGVLILYMQKQPGRHVTVPKTDSKALDW
ncbi:hypothetical protein OGAPHI_000286 [Ogataea philodendri]|uniref:Uncharacterized protein n=1 Tax=Ogataea philodendri TaxID=1378263 RepID=A0A9P8T9Q2_9ASCO|nr:uncharacterized protein OGAPHI_000286 [Ogataea philodendri]KAH3671583.1 hypothetical protein OGAPHI_000286 [Ogataea philodendri]